MPGVSRSAIEISGIRQLSNRLLAVADDKTRTAGLRDLGLLAVGYAKEEAPKKTGNLARRIRLRSANARTAIIASEAAYSRPVHDGQRAHEIVPNKAKVLRWPTSSSSRRLTGTARKSSGGFAFAKRVKHPGAQPNRFLTRGLQRAAKDGVRLFKASVIKSWNGGA